MIGRKLIGNSFSILLTRLTQSVTTFVLSAFIARLLGAYELGQYLLAFGYYFIFMSIASQGVKVLFTRELSRNPSEVPTYLVSGTLLQFCFSSVAYLLMGLLVYVLPYQESTSLICYVMGLAIFPFSLSNITESIFQSEEKMYLITLSTVPVYILRVFVMIGAMQAGYGVIALAGIMVLSEVLIMGVEWLLALRFIKPIWRIDWDFMRSSLRAVRTFIAIEGVAVINTRMQMLILSVLGGEVVVGLYGAIVQLMQPFDILSNSFTVGVFPSMTKTVALGLNKQRDLAERIIEMLAIVAMPIILGLLFFGRDVLHLVYQKPDFDAAAVPLMIVAFGLIAASFNRPLSYLLVANHFERLNMYEVIITTTSTGILGVILVSKFQLMGAAISMLFMRLIGCAQYVYGVSANLFVVRFWKILKRPLLVSGLMLLVFLLLRSSVNNIVVILLVSVFAYAVLIGALVLFALGGFKSAYGKLLQR